MKNIIGATAMSLMMSTMMTTGSFADNHMAPFAEYNVAEKDIRASEMIGMRIYATENEIDENAMIEDDGEKEWDDVGEVNEVILGRDGSVKAVILGIGGFLGLGEKDVAVPMDKIRIVREKDDADDFFLVVNSNKEMLEQSPGVTYESAEMENDRETTRDDTGRTMLRTPNLPSRDGYREAKYEELTTENLTGARVYGLNDEDVGEIDKLILSDDGKITRAVIDVGGFLGIGEHAVAVTFDELKIIRDEGWSDVRVYIDASQEELEAQPEYKD